ncbi:hypothetical protein VZT92_012850 [Zoarces viviparus]|uniref:Uncharacterized protein n=1 Tax=Zoarces viviparus TaxID=48416 RepID=A0AAW1F2E2_ZOAVI
MYTIILDCFCKSPPAPLSAPRSYNTLTAAAAPHASSPLLFLCSVLSPPPSLCACSLVDAFGGKHSQRETAKRRHQPRDAERTREITERGRKREAVVVNKGVCF